MSVILGILVRYINELHYNTGMEANLSLEDQFRLPLVQDLLEENKRITARLSTKLPDSKIENLTVPHTFEHKLLMAPGEHNGIFYSKESIMAKVEIADGVQLFLDHKDSTGEGAQNWVGSIDNPVYELIGDQGEGMYGDLIIVDKPSAQKLAAGAKLGISPTIDFDRTDFGDTTSASDLMWKSFSLVSGPAIRATMLNSKLNKTGDPMEPAKTFPYKQTVRMEKEGTPVTETIELSDEKAVELLEKKDTDIKELRKVNKELTEKLEKFETTQKEGLVANLTANEFLVGRLEAAEMEERAKALMEKSPEILEEVKGVIGDHARLQEFKDFVKTFRTENKDKNIKDAALSWAEQATKPAPAKLGVEAVSVPAVPTAPVVPAAKDGSAELQAASLVGTPTEPQKQTAELSEGHTDADKAMFNSMYSQIFPEVPL